MSVPSKYYQNPTICLQTTRLPLPLSSHLLHPYQLCTILHLATSDYSSVCEIRTYFRGGIYRVNNEVSPIKNTSQIGRYHRIGDHPSLISRLLARAGAYHSASQLPPHTRPLAHSTAPRGSTTVALYLPPRVQAYHTP